MNEFNELQNIWKSGKNEIKKTIPQLVPGNLLEKLKKLESNQTRLNRLKVVVLALLFTKIIYMLNRFNIAHPSVYVGLCTIFLGVIMFMVYYFRNQFSIKKLDFTANSIDFTNKAKRMLEKQNSIFKWPFLIFAFIVLIGTNVMITGISTDEIGLMIHLKISVFVLISTFAGYRIRMWRTRKEVTPLLKELNLLKDNLESEI